VIQEHIRFAESILASPTNSESGRRSRSFSPLPPHIALSPAHQTVRPAARSRSCSPLARWISNPYYKVWCLRSTLFCCWKSYKTCIL